MSKEEKHQSPIKCLYCNKKFTPNRKWHKYCSTTCRVKAWYENNQESNLAERVKKLEEKVGV